MLDKYPHTLHNPMRSLLQLGKEAGFKNLSALLIMLSASGDFPFFEGDAGVMLTGKNESYLLPGRHCLLITV